MKASRAVQATGTDAKTSEPTMTDMAVVCVCVWVGVGSGVYTEDEGG